MFPLNDHFPGLDAMEIVAKRYKEFDQSAVESYLSMVRLTSRFQSRADAYFQRMDLSQGRFMIMIILLKSGSKGVTPAEMATNISCARATITGLLDTLEASGFIERRADPNGDRRSLTVHLTAAGLAKLDSILPAHYTRISQAMAEFSAEERRQMIQLVNKFTKGIQAFEDISLEDTRDSLPKKENP